jgi:PAS domain S-box-containing protein
MARILIVEDESVAAWYLQEALENFGHQVVASAISGEEALEFAADTQPDLVLMDIRLQGGIDGIAAAEQMRSRFDLPVVYLTAHADDSTLRRAIATNPFGYLVKPFHEREVHTTIEIALRRHQLEKRSEDTKQWFVNTFDSIGDPTIATDCNGDIIFINPVACSLTGWLQQEALGKAATTVLKLIHAQTRKEIENPLIQAMREQASVSLPENSLLLAKDGREIPIRDTAGPIRNSNGEIIGSVLVLQDDTVRQQALSAIQQRNHSLELTQVTLIARLQERTTQLQQALACTLSLKRMMTQVQQGATQIQILQTTISELGRLLEADYAWVVLYNDNRTLATISCEYISQGELHTCAEALGSKIHMHSYPDFYRPLLHREHWLSPPLELLPAPYKVLLRADSEMMSCPLVYDELVIGEVSILSTGKPPWSLLHAELIAQVVSQCAVFLQQAHSYQVAQNNVADLQFLNHVKDNFISSIFPELFTPLGNMKMAVEMLSSLVHSFQSANNQTETPQNGQPLWQKLEQYLQVLREEWQQEFDLVCDLLNFQSLESLPKSVPSSSIDLQQWLPQLVNRFSKQAVRQRQVLSCQVSPELLIVVSHELSLERIVTELLNNACKFSPPDSSIAVTAYGEGENVVIQVTNTGVIIPFEELDRIFEPFYRIPNPNLWNSGTGLGLALVKKLVQLLGGGIQVESEVGETTFIVTLLQGQPVNWKDEAMLR